MNVSSMKRAKKYLLGLAVIAIAATAGGCESLTMDSAASKKKKKDASWFSFKKKEYKNPQSMTATWSHDILTLPGKAPTRGFGGRFYFYDEKTHAIPVEGEMVVYGFDDTNKQMENEELSQATKRFRFTAEQFTTHFTEGELGVSYSIWIPWDEAYGAPKRIMLIPTFLTKEGKVIRGTAASLNLPGSTKNEPKDEMVQQASAKMTNMMSNPLLSQQNSGMPNAMSGLRTTSIQVPSQSLMRQQNNPPLLSNLSEMQTQQFASAMNMPSNQNIQQSQGPMNTVEQMPQTVSPNLNTTVATPPAQSGMATKNVNGWAVPQYAPVNWSGLSPHSAPNQFQAPASQVAQPTSFPTR